ncbi:MAG: ROK family protein [Pseudomonadota bacterium]
MPVEDLIAAVDAGGTNFKCALVRSDGTILKAWSVPTTGPDQTLAACSASFRAALEALGGRAKALGIASFGPVEIDPNSSRYGVITGTAKPDWHGAEIGPDLGSALGCPFALDTDVNAALAAEMRWGAGRSVGSIAYITVGTGIGAGLYLNGEPVGRPAHPEFGHIRVARHPDDTGFDGVCSLHGDCLEGLASGPALRARWGDPAGLRPDHPGWDIEAHYLAQACLNLYLATRLERIIIGGGVMTAQHLIGKVQAAFDGLMGDYLPVSGAGIICAPELGAHAGVLGGAVVAMTAFS